LQAKRNQLSKTVGMKKAKGEDAAAEMAEAIQVNSDMEAGASRLPFCKRRSPILWQAFRICPMNRTHRQRRKRQS
jgi:seryl-tRNA synthetase